MSENKTLKILEWNVNSKSTGLTMPDYVPSEILRKDPDVVVLVEFKGDNNKKLMEKWLTNYNIYVSDATPVNSKKKNTGNSILIALSKDTFPNLIKDKNISCKKEDDSNVPDWIKINTEWNNQPFDVIGIKVIIGGENKPDFQSRKKQIKWVLDDNKESKTNIIIGDFDFEPYNTNYKLEEDEDSKINWQDIIFMMRDYEYLYKKFNGGTYSPYAPIGMSYKSSTLDWLIGKGISVIRRSVYNNLDWSFGRYNSDMKFVDGYLTVNNYFIPNNPPYPDHAIFTAEIEPK